MPKFVIERELPGAGRLTDSEIQGIAQKSCEVLDQLGTDIHWLESFVTDDKIYCIYHAANESIVRQHATLGGFPADRISPVRRVIDMTTAEPVPVGV